MGLSIIIPTFNEATNSYFKENLKLLKNFGSAEIIIADGNSTDSTLSLVDSFNYKILLNAGNTRAERLNAGVQASREDMILLVHPRNLLNAKALNALFKLSNEKIWGGFTHKFDKSHVFYKWTSWYSNQIRAKRRDIFYLDHCIFFHKSFIHCTKASFIPIMPIFEDTALSNKLKKIQPSTLLPYETITSSIRFENNGPLKQSLKNLILKFFFFFNISGHKANAFYEKKMNLNNIYDK